MFGFVGTDRLARYRQIKLSGFAAWGSSTSLYPSLPP
jgi:hypothetical protein